jgi:hypothetical protein
MCGWMFRYPGSVTVFRKTPSEARVLSALGTDLSIAGTAILNALLHTPEMVVITGKVFGLKP